MTVPKVKPSFSLSSSKDQTHFAERIPTELVTVTLLQGHQLQLQRNRCNDDFGFLNFGAPEGEIPRASTVVLLRPPQYSHVLDRKVLVFYSAHSIWATLFIKYLLDRLVDIRFWMKLPHYWL